MAGQFVLWKMPPQVLATYTGIPGVGWTGLAHAARTPSGVVGVDFAGWTVQTSAELNRVRSGVAIGNRNNLPPHRYLTFPPGQPGLALATQLQLDKYGWLTDLERPVNVGFGLVALCPAAAAIWNAGQTAYRHDALIAQITHGATSIEVYYLGSKQMS